jgi:predicted nucleic acid-binding protein
MNLVDSSGWIEYFAKGKNAHLFRPVIQNVDELIVSTINLYEVFKKIHRESGETEALQAIAFMEQALVVEVDEAIALTAAKLSTELKIPMADSLILATARVFRATLWTQDVDFEGIPNVRYFSKNS